MLRLFKGRWMWGMAAVMATAYLFNRSRQSAGFGRMRSDALADDAYRLGRGALDAVMRTGRSMASSTMRAMSRR